MKELIDSGIVIVDKPPTPTSHEVTAWVKKLVGAAKAGHAGTLDPNVTGVLPVGLNRATRVLHYIAPKEKEYVGIMRFKEIIGEEKVRELFKKFTGEIDQMVPKMAAVRRRLRKRKVYNLNLLEYKDHKALFSVICEAGTYVRVLCADIGKDIGGAAMLELRRTAVGNIRENVSSRMQDISDAAWLYQQGDESALRKIIRPVEEFIALKKIVAKDTAIEAVCYGASLSIPGIAGIDETIARGESVAVMSSDGELVAIGSALLSGSEIKSLRKGIAIKTVRVVMEKGRYPKAW